MTKLIINLIKFHIIMAVFSITKVSGQTALPTIFTDKAFVSDDICSLIINEHPCVKNVLGVLVDHINQNLQRIQLYEQAAIETQKIKDQKLDALRLKLELLEYKFLDERKTHEKSIDILQNDLKDTINQNKLLKTEVDFLKSKFHWKGDFPRIQEKKDLDFPYDFHFKTVFDKFSESNSLRKEGLRLKLSNSSMVSENFILT